MHSLGIQQICYSRTHFKDAFSVKPDSQEMNIKITPDHQSQRIASDDIDLSVIAEDFTQAASKQLIRRGMKFVVAIELHHVSLNNPRYQCPRLLPIFIELCSKHIA